MNFSSAPFLFLLQAAFWLWLIRSTYARQQLTKSQALSIMFWLFMLIAWGFVTSVLSINGTYNSSEFLNLLPGFWLPLVPIVITSGLYASCSTFKDALTHIVAKTPLQTFILIQTLRIAAAGSLYKASQGLMPVDFVLLVGIPDLLYAISALVIANTIRLKSISPLFLGYRNLIGIAIIVATAPLVMQLGLPGPLYIIEKIPDSQVLLKFPMILAPTLVVLFFIIINAIAANHLLRNRL